MVRPIKQKNFKLSNPKENLVTETLKEFVFGTPWRLISEMQSKIEDDSS